MARNRKPNKPIGTCPCPFRGCEETAKVYRYRAQSDDPTKQRRAGKLYIRCQEHGVTQDQSWILDHADITNDEPADEMSADRPSDSTPADRTPAQPDVDPPRKDNTGGWGFF